MDLSKKDKSRNDIRRTTKLIVELRRVALVAMSAQSESQSSFKFLPLGAIIQSFDVSGKNIVLNFPTEEDYAKRNEPHFGETIGRVANRLKYAVMHLNGRDYMLDKNDPPNCIHGGFKGWGQQTFHPARERRHGKDAWRFSYTSGNNDGKFPGTVEVTLWYTEYEKQDLRRKTVLEIEYEVSARDMECEETAVNVTNHRYVLPISTLTLQIVTNMLIM